MGYTYSCDDCGDDHDSLPAFMGEIRETWFKTTEIGGYLADEGYSPGQTITICGPCLKKILSA